MRFEWDKQKNKANIAKHGFDFADAPRIFRLPMFVSPDERKEYGEERWSIGLLDGRIVVVVYTETENETIRIISLRKALSYERKNMSNISETDWSRIDTMTDKDIDTSDISPLSEEFFAKARLRMLVPSLTVLVRTDPETLAWFQSQGETAEQQMATALRIYAESDKMHSDYLRKAE